MEQEIRIHLNIPPERYLAYYRGTARTVTARSVDGRSVRFPATVLQPFIRRDGIRGTFVLRVGGDNKFLGIRKVGDDPIAVV